MLKVPKRLSAQIGIFYVLRLSYNNWHSPLFKRKTALYDTVIGHGIGGIDIPAKMAQLAKCKITGVSNNGPSASPDLEASQISDG